MHLTSCESVLKCLKIFFTALPLPTMAPIATTSKCSPFHWNYPQASRATSAGAIFPPAFAGHLCRRPTASPPSTGSPRQGDGHCRKESRGRPEKGRHSHDSIQVISRRGSQQYRPFKSSATSAETNRGKDTEKEEKSRTDTRYVVTI